MGCMAEFRDENHCWEKKTLRLDSFLPPLPPKLFFFLMITKTCRKILWWLTGQRLNFFLKVYPIASFIRAALHFQKNVKAAVKPGGGSVTVWGLFGCYRAWNTTGTPKTGTIHYVHPKILKDSVQQFVLELKLKRPRVLQQENDPRRTSTSTSEWLKKNKMKILECRWSESWSEPRWDASAGPQNRHIVPEKPPMWLNYDNQGSNSFTAPQKTFCELSQILDCSYYVLWGAVGFSHRAMEVWIFFLSPLNGKTLI